jgi:hypothetical protein
MPSYTVDNPSKNLAKAEEAAQTLLGDNLVKVLAVNPANPTRVSVETKAAIDSTELSQALAKLVPKAVAVAPVDKGTEVKPVDAPSNVAEPAVAPTIAVPEPAAPAAVPEPAAPAATVVIVP